MKTKSCRITKKTGKGSRMILHGDNFILDISIKGKGSFDWRNTARGLLLETIIDKSKKFFESLPADEKKLNIDVNGDAWKESDRVLQALYSNDKLNKLFEEVKKEIHRYS